MARYTFYHEWCIVPLFISNCNLFSNSEDVTGAANKYNNVVVVFRYSRNRRCTSLRQMSFLQMSAITP